MGEEAISIHVRLQELGTAGGSRHLGSMEWKPGDASVERDSRHHYSSFLLCSESPTDCYLLTVGCRGREASIPVNEATFPFLAIKGTCQGICSLSSLLYTGKITSDKLLSTENCWSQWSCADFRWFWIQWSYTDLHQFGLCPSAITEVRLIHPPKDLAHCNPLTEARWAAVAGGVSEIWTVPPCPRLSAWIGSPIYHAQAQRHRVLQTSPDYGLPWRHSSPVRIKL